MGYKGFNRRKRIVDNGNSEVRWLASKVYHDSL